MVFFHKGRQDLVWKSDAGYFQKNPLFEHPIILVENCWLKQFKVQTKGVWRMKFEEISACSQCSFRTAKKGCVEKNFLFSGTFVWNFLHFLRDSRNSNRIRGNLAISNLQRIALRRVWCQTSSEFGILQRDTSYFTYGIRPLYSDSDNPVLAVPTSELVAQRFWPQTNRHLISALSPGSFFYRSSFRIL